VSLLSDEKSIEEMNFIKIMGYNIRYIKINKINSTETVVLLHGIGASAERWSDLLPCFDSRYDIIIPDIIGFGYSEKPLIEYSIDMFMKFLDEFFSKLNIKNPIIIGSSFGGQLVIEYCLKNPQYFKKIVLVSPAGTQIRSTFVLSQYIFSALYPTIDNAKRAFQMMSNSNHHIVNDYVIKDFVNRMRLPNAKYAFISTLLALRKNNNLKNKLGEIIVPTLVVWGRNDATIPVSNIEYFKANGLIKTCVIEDCGHTPFVEKPQEFYKLVKDFIES
jgi:pimeloyl-ACP methyl ester carboxylesterase